MDLVNLETAVPVQCILILSPCTIHALKPQVFWLPICCNSNSYGAPCNVLERDCTSLRRLDLLRKLLWVKGGSIQVQDLPTKRIPELPSSPGNPPMIIVPTNDAALQGTHPSAQSKTQALHLFFDS